jgi:hypothetical protein
MPLRLPRWADGGKRQLCVAIAHIAGEVAKSASVTGAVHSIGINIPIVRIHGLELRYGHITANMNSFMIALDLVAG